MIKRTDTILSFDRNFDWRRFESLCFEILDEDYEWSSPLEHFGGSGNGDGGIDIRGIQKENDRIWLVQCKKRKVLHWNDLKKTVDRITEKPTLSHVFVLMTSSVVSLSNRTKLKEYAQNKGYADSYVLSVDEISSKVYGSKKNLIQRYFGEKTDEDRIVEELKRRDRMKLEAESKLLRNDIPENLTQRGILCIISNPEVKFIESEVIIVPIDDFSFPEYEVGQSRWYESNIHDLYINGIEIWIAAAQGTKVLLNAKHEWQPIDNDFQENCIPNGFSIRQVRMIGRIPYSSISHIQTDADPINTKPVIRCRFEFDDAPYESIKYVLTDNKGGVDNWPRLENENRVNLVETKLP